MLLFLDSDKAISADSGIKGGHKHQATNILRLC